MIAGDLQDIMRTIKSKGAALEANEQPIDTGAGAGKCFLDMLGVASSAGSIHSSMSGRAKSFPC